MVTAQITLSLALLIVSALFVRGAALGSRTDPGFPLDRTVHAEVDPSLAYAVIRVARKLDADVAHHVSVGRAAVPLDARPVARKALVLG